MSTRLPRTATDWLLTAINLILVILMVGSLAFFLLDVFYHGNFSGRLHWIVGLYVMAVVLIAEIAMEMGRGRAHLYALPLLVVTVVALQRFVVFTGPLAGMSLPINLAIVAVIWWSAQQLTFDCVQLDDEDAPGEGLLDTPSRSESQADETAAPPGGQFLQRMEEWLALKRSSAAPGRWVILFSLAAIPLFGIGQLFLPPGQTGHAGWGTVYLAVYLLSGLALLMTTSLLEARRYLRRRRFPIPLDVTIRRLLAGLVFVAVILGIALLLPRPATQAVSDASWMTSPDLNASQQGWGREGTDDPNVPGRVNEPQSESQTGSQTAEEAQSPGNQAGEGDSSSEQGRQQGNTRQEVDQQGRSQSSETGQSDGDAEQGSETQSEQPQDAQRGDPSGQSSQTPPEKSSPEPDKEPQNDQQAQNNRTSTEQPNPEHGRQRTSNSAGRQRQRRRDTVESSSRDQAEREPSDSSESQAPQRRLPMPQLPTFTGLAAMFRWLLWIVFLAVLVYLAIRYRTAVLEVLAQWRDAFGDWWRRLFGRSSDSGAVAVAIPEGNVTQRRLPFSAFSDPFLDGRVDRESRAEIIVYTFRALEAWGAGYSHGRREGETPREYTRRVSEAAAPVAEPLQHLGVWYSQVVYTRLPEQPWTESQREQLVTLWGYLRTYPPRESSSPSTPGRESEPGPAMNAG